MPVALTREGPISMKNNPLLFIIAGFCLAFGGVAAFAFGNMQGTDEAKAGIAIVCVLGIAVLTFGIIRWREEQDEDAATF
jgi:hypothetical protein